MTIAEHVKPCTPKKSSSPIKRVVSPGDDRMTAAAAARQEAIVRKFQSGAKFSRDVQRSSSDCRTRGLLQVEADSDTLDTINIEGSMEGSMKRPRSYHSGEIRGTMGIFGVRGTPRSTSMEGTSPDFHSNRAESVQLKTPRGSLAGSSGMPRCKGV